VLTITGQASVGASRTTLFADLESSVDELGPTPVVLQIDASATGRTSSMGTSMAAEVECLQLAAGVGVPAPFLLMSTLDERWVGGPFTVSSRVDGVTIPRHILRAVHEHPELGDQLAQQCGQALARLHQITAAEVSPQIPRLDSPTAAAAYIVERTNSNNELLQASPAMALGLRWMRLNTPSPPPAPSMVHGDLRNGNIIVDPSIGHDGKAIGLAAILDWELAHIGDPMEDLAWLCTRFWRFGNDELTTGGFGTLESLRSGYEAEGGVWRDDAFRWWQVARALWWAQGLAGQARSFVDGTSASLVHAASGRRVAELEHDLLELTDEPL